MDNTKLIKNLKLISEDNEVELLEALKDALNQCHSGYGWVDTDQLCIYVEDITGNYPDPALVLELVELYDLGEIRQFHDERNVSLEGFDQANLNSFPEGNNKIIVTKNRGEQNELIHK